MFTTFKFNTPAATRSPFLSQTAIIVYASIGGLMVLALVIVCCCLCCATECGRELAEGVLAVLGAVVCCLFCCCFAVFGKGNDCNNCSIDCKI